MNISVNVSSEPKGINWFCDADQRSQCTFSQVWALQSDYVQRSSDYQQIGDELHYFAAFPPSQWPYFLAYKYDQSLFRICLVINQRWFMLDHITSEIHKDKVKVILGGLKGLKQFSLTHVLLNQITQFPLRIWLCGLRALSELAQASKSTSSNYKTPSPRFNYNKGLIISVPNCLTCKLCMRNMQETFEDDTYLASFCLFLPLVLPPILRLWSLPL